MRNALLTAGMAVALAAGAALAQVQTPQPVQQNNSNAIWFENWTGLSNAQMRIAAPDGTLTTLFAETGTPVFQLSGSDVVDGVWNYELSAATEERVEIANPIDNGRGDAGRDSVAVPFYMAGRFVVQRGVIVQPEDQIEE